VADEPGALPLLSHALLETRKRREGRTLTFAGYTDSGGVREAITRTADSVFGQQLDPRQQGIARSIFLRLTELGDASEDTRQRATRARLATSLGNDADCSAVLDRLIEARLVTTEEETVEVAHEALIREWPTLRHWLNEDREGLRIHRHLTRTAQDWAARKDPDELYREARLATAREWADEHASELNALEREFLDASIARQRAEKERQQRRLAPPGRHHPGAVGLRPARIGRVAQDAAHAGRVPARLARRGRHPRSVSRLASWYTVACGSRYQSNSWATSTASLGSTRTPATSRGRSGSSR
jgi:hypothetical protein